MARLTPNPDRRKVCCSEDNSGRTTRDRTRVTSLLFCAALLASVFWRLAAFAPATLAAADAALYLHTTAGKDSLDTSAPTGSTPKYKDSPALNRRSGSSGFQEIGSWIAQGTIPFNPGSSTALYGWVALKGADVNATFDIHAELSKNGTVVSTGDLEDVDDLPRYQSGATPVVMTLSPPAAGRSGSSGSGGQGVDTWKLRILVRIGTKCGLQNATGIRWFYDSVDRPSRLGPQPAPPPKNLPPVVEAGPKLDVTLPASASLNGTVSDDGMPANAKVTSLWTKTSGPGTVTFANSASATTTATFSRDGSYVLRLTASDSKLSAFDETTVTVHAQVNLAPIVSAGPDLEITLPASATLSGKVTDDGLPVYAGVTSTWTKTSGPGSVTFAKTTAPATTATFSRDGTYVLRLTASDSKLSAYDEATVTVYPKGAVNHPPIASAGGPYTSETAKAIAFSSTGSSDPDGDTLAFAWAFGDGATSTDPNPSHAYASAGAFTATLAVSDGHGGQATATAAVTVVNANRPPVITSQTPVAATEGAPYTYLVLASDPDGDPIAFRLAAAPDGMTIGMNGAIAWTPVTAQVGSQNVSIEASDGRGGIATQTFAVVVAPAATVTSIDVTPESLRFSALGARRSLSVTGLRSDGSTVDLTSDPASTYQSGSPFVVSVDATGTVTSVANGSATVTVTNHALADSVAVVVEVGVTLDSFEISPSSATLRTVGASLALSGRGHFSDGTTRDLTTAEGTTYQSADPRVASVDASGTVTATGSGDVVITARHDAFSATTNVHVAVSSGTGFLRGQVLDDSRGLPLDGAVITLVADGGGPLPSPLQVVADGGGRFVLPARAGDAIVRIARGGFTTVERRAVVSADAAERLLDARLTPVDGRVNTIVSVFGGDARDSAGTTTVAVPPGALPATTDLRLTTMSGQGLAGRLPFGWSPIAAVDIEPAGVAFAQTAMLTLPNAVTIAPQTPIVVVRYDSDRHEWIAIGLSTTGADGRSCSVTIASTGSFACLAPDEAPTAPPAATIGEALTGSAAAGLPADVTIAGDVTPRAAPPGDGAHAIGRVHAEYGSALPSGLTVQAAVSERFDLTDQSQSIPEPFTEDIVLYAQGRPAGDGVLGAAFPITPSRNFTIQELLHGVVSLDVASAATVSATTVVGSVGGNVGDADGDNLAVPPAAIGADTIVGIRHVASDQTTIPIAAGFDLLAAVNVDLIGVVLAHPADLSIAAPASVTAADQILLAAVVQDPLGALHPRLVGVGVLDGGRVIGRVTLGALSFAGITSGGQFLFLRAQQPIGFLTGRVFSADGTTPRSQALVTTDTAPFADITPATGGFLVAGLAGADLSVRALDLVAHDAGMRPSHVTSRDEIVPADVTLAAIAPTVTATSPNANATNVPLDASITIDFSDPIDPASLTDAGVVLSATTGVVAGQRTLSADQRRLVFRPGAPLSGNTLYTLTLGGVRSTVGRTLSGFTALAFTSLDPSKPTLGTSGLITGDLPDEDGFVLVTGSQGASAASSPVTATNLRTQETTTVLANQDGSFRLRVSAAIGDEIALSLRDSSSRDTTISLTQLRAADGTTSASERGGTIAGARGRMGTLLPRSLTQAGLFRIDDAVAGVTLPSLPDGFSYADQFHFSSQASQFNTLSAFTLSESQNRFQPLASTSTPFSAQGELTVPGDFLVNASLGFTAAAVDASGTRRTISGATAIVTANADGTATESGQTTDFPTVFLVSPKQALPNQLVDVSAIAPAARVDLEVPAAAGTESAATLLLVRRVTLGGDTKLAIVDRFVRADNGVGAVLRTNGRDLPGMSSTGDYAVVASTAPLVFVEGRLTGAAATATLDGSPFVFATNGPNGTFLLPVAAGQPFTLHYLDAGGAVIGTSTGQAPATGQVDLGSPLAPSGNQLTVTADPDATATVDIGQPLVFRFSEPVDGRTLTSGVIVTDGAGSRVFGTLTLSTDDAIATFKPSRRWRFGTTYRWGITTAVLAVSGAKLPQQASGEFSTFAPRVLGTLAVGTAHDVAVAGTNAVVATDAGLATVDVTSAVAPAIEAQLPLVGGAHGVALLTDATFTDRSGQSHTGSFAAVASGNATGAGRLDVVDVSSPDQPAAIGTSQLTPSGGTPNAVVMMPNQLALAAVQNVGVESVRIGDAVPPDPANPGRALGPQYPASTPENVNHVALLGDRLLTAGVAGLTVLDAATLERRGGVSTTGDARGVAVLGAFSIDLNGDGTIAPDSEIFDLAAVANGADGTLQFYRVPSTGDPVLLSVVHFTGDINGVALDANERLAYVSLGVRGVALVDLDGPASIQPIDLDHNGVDDRILGVVDTPGSAERVALALDRGIGLVADGEAGVTAVQLIPPRARFLSLQRDPSRQLSGEEQAILDSRVAFTTDEGLEAVLGVVLATQTRASLVIEETPRNGGPRLLSFAEGDLAAPLVDGPNTIAINLGASQPSSGSDVTLKVVSATGSALAALQFRIDQPDPAGRVLRSLRMGPVDPVIAANQESLKLSVVGLFADGLVLNLTTPETGTTYSVSDTRVATVDSIGLVTAVAGGGTEVGAINRDSVAIAHISVDHQAVLVGLETPVPFVTLTSLGATAGSAVTARLSDGSTQDASTVGGTTYSSSDASIVAVDASGTLIARGEGLATIFVSNGAFTAAIQVAAEFRTPPNLTAIHLAPLPGNITTDDAQVEVSATISGTGSLEGLTVTFSVTGAAIPAVTAVTSYGGVAIAALKGFATPVAATVAATVVNPASGQTFTDSLLLTIAPGSGDLEPNNTAESASRLALDRTIGGTLSAADPSDVYRVDVAADGVLTTNITLGAGTNPGDIVIIVRDANGVEIGRFTPTNDTKTLDLPANSGPVFLSVTGAGLYSLNLNFTQADITVGGVSPSSGGPGTLATIDGSGFSTGVDATRVLFAGSVAKLVSVSPTRIQVLVPAGAADGEIEVVSGARHVTGPVFAVGVAQPTPIAVIPGDPVHLRIDPITRTLLDVTRLVVYFDPIASRGQAETLASSLNGVIVGANRVLNSYTIEFRANTTITGLEVLRRQFEANALVRFTTRSRFTPVQTSLTIDGRDQAGTWPPASAAVPRGKAYDVARIFDAFDVIRSTPPFDGSGRPFKQVRVAIIDSGFDPKQILLSKFDSTAARLLVSDPVLGFVTQTVGLDTDFHGTEVASMIAAVNTGTGLSGALNGVLKPGECASPGTLECAFPLSVYRASGWSAGTIAQELAINALSDIVQRNRIPSLRVDVVNMSFAGAYPAVTADFRDEARAYREATLPLAGQTLVVIAAGNKGTDAQFSIPATLANEPWMTHVMTIGASGVASTGVDARAIFGAPDNSPGPRCDPSVLQTREESNCGATVTLAAPGEDIMSIAARGDFGAPPDGYKRFGGTSGAAPIVAGVAGLLQAIRPTQAPTPPDRLRAILVKTADDISGTWRPLPMRRLNALSAVRAVLGVAPDNNSIYVADHRAPGVADRPGKIIAVRVDPLTGVHIGGSSDAEIVPTYASDGFLFLGKEPTALAVSPVGDKLFAMVTSETPILGDGLLVVNTQTLKAHNFIPLSGDSPTASDQRPIVSASSLNPGMVFSKDGRLLYVANGLDLVIINTVEEKVVGSLADLPAPYNIRADRLPPGVLDDRHHLLQAAALAAPPGGRPGQGLAGLALSPDGRTLYAAVHSGHGGGQQPGAAIAINVDLYTDADARTPGLQSDLSAYFMVITPPMRQQTAPGASTTALGDEPSSVAVSGDGEHLYLINQGVEAFEAIPPADLDLSKFLTLMEGPIMASPVAAGAGLLGVLSTLVSFNALAPGLYRDLLADLTQALKGGETFLAAPGFVGVFGASSSLADFGQQSWLFPSDLGFVWHPPADNGGLIINQFSFPNVFAKRPSGFAMHPKSRRALVPFFQTGNFGLLDLDLQPLNAAGQPPNVFEGFIAATPSVPLDNHLWPSRGVFSSNGALVPSPDESLLFTSQAEYAQNGKFAVASHVGVGDPRAVDAVIPDFVNDDKSRLAMLQLGGQSSAPLTTIIDDGQPLSISVGAAVKLHRGGGALSIINDQAVSGDFALNALSSVPSPLGANRPYFASNPITDTAVAHVFSYDAPTGTSHFYEPRGVTVQPFVMIESPRFGDHVTSGTALQISWRDPRPVGYRVEIRDETNLLLDTFKDAFTESNPRTVAVTIDKLFEKIPLVGGSVYHLTVSLVVDATTDLSATTIDVVVEQ